MSATDEGCLPENGSMVGSQLEDRPLTPEAGHAPVVAEEPVQADHAAGIAFVAEPEETVVVDVAGGALVEVLAQMGDETLALRVSPAVEVAADSASADGAARAAHDANRLPPAVQRDTKQPKQPGPSPRHADAAPERSPSARRKQRSPKT